MCVCVYKLSAGVKRSGNDPISERVPFFFNDAFVFAMAPILLKINVSIALVHRSHLRVKVHEATKLFIYTGRIPLLASDPADSHSKYNPARLAAICDCFDLVLGGCCILLDETTKF